MRVIEGGKSSDNKGRIEINWNGEHLDSYYLDGELWTRFDLLAAASDLEDENKAWEIMGLASKLFHAQNDATFNKLYGAVAMEITRTFSQSEYRVHGLFNSNCEKIFP